MPATPPPSEERLRAGLCGPDRLWEDVEVVDSVDSTNAVSARRLRDGRPAPQPGRARVLVADHQSRGRGRFDRRWEAPPGTALATSVVVTPRRPMPDWMWLSLLTGVAIARGVAGVTGLRPVLKWPNDVLLDGRKICGILSERVDPGGSAACVVGFGINVSLVADELPVPTATSLALAGAEVDKSALLVAVLGSWEEMYRAWDAGDHDRLREAYEHTCATIGRPVRVLLQHPRGADTSVTGVARGVDATGALQVDTGSGLQAFAAGDVTHLR